MQSLLEPTYTHSVVALVSLSTYSACLETVAGDMTRDLKRKWFQALLRQDVAYFDLQDVSGTAMTISINGAKYKRYDT
jgi:ABC-type multidrug transport system fused ATPase/permease subunit